MEEGSAKTAVPPVSNVNVAGTSSLPNAFAAVTSQDWTSAGLSVAVPLPLSVKVRAQLSPGRHVNVAVKASAGLGDHHRRGDRGPPLRSSKERSAVIAMSCETVHA